MWYDCSTRFGGVDRRDYISTVVPSANAGTTPPPGHDHRGESWAGVLRVIGTRPARISPDIPRPFE